jgi:ribosomal protein S18 acetylase RimI-like enzyme
LTKYRKSNIVAVEERTMEIKSAKEFDNTIRDKISALFVDAFGKDLKIISTNKEKLIKAFSHMFQPECFYVCIIDNEVAGMIACTNKEQYCTKHNRKILIHNLGIIKGILADMIFKKYFCKYPKYSVALDNKTGSIEFVATDSKHRNKGISTKIMEHIFSLSLYEKYILEVADTNVNAYNLYKKWGFKEIHRIKLAFTKIVKINYMVYMSTNRKAGTV